MNWFCDGGLTKICVTNDNGEVFIEKIEGTNNENEYRSMILVLQKAQDGDFIFADSQLVVMQLLKKWKVKKVHLYPLFIEARKLFDSKKITVEWISRDFNLAGHILEGL